MKTASLFCLSAALFLQGALSQTPTNPAPAASATANEKATRLHYRQQLLGDQKRRRRQFKRLRRQQLWRSPSQTAEVIKTFGQRCTEIIVNNHLSASDYVVELDHEGGKGLLRHKDKIAVFVQFPATRSSANQPCRSAAPSKTPASRLQAIGPATNRRSNRQPSPRKPQSPSQRPTCSGQRRSRGEALPHCNVHSSWSRHRNQRKLHGQHTVNH